MGFNFSTHAPVFYNGTSWITLANAASYVPYTGAASDLALGTHSITMTGSLGATGARLAYGWFTDLTVTNIITGSISGNSVTVTNGVYTTDAGTVFVAPTNHGDLTLAPGNLTFTPEAAPAARAGRRELVRKFFAFPACLAAPRARRSAARFLESSTSSAGPAASAPSEAPASVRLSSFKN